MLQPPTLDRRLPDVATAAQAAAAGLTPDQVRQRVRSGRWTRLARGVYRTTPIAADLDAHAARRVDHAQRAVAAALVHDGCAIGFASAAIVHGLPLHSPVPAEVSLVAGPGGWNGRRDGVRVHRVELRVGDVIQERVPITSVARTWFDVARTATLADAIAVGDAALRHGDVGRAELQRVLDPAFARRGVRQAELACAHLDGTRETVLESASWAYFVEHRIPLPEMQMEIRAVSGRVIARVDFLWRGRRVIGECDGRLKYLTPDDLYREKRREDELRAEGLGVQRWGWSDLRSDDLAIRLCRVLT